MVTAIRSREEFDLRTEKRTLSQLFVMVKSLDLPDEYCFDALTEDISDSGVALLANLALPLGTHIAIYIGNEIAATGEVIDLHWDEWGRSGMVRISVHFFTKGDNWPI
jgi:hypothetical protein